LINIQVGHLLMCEMMEAVKNAGQNVMRMHVCKVMDKTLLRHFLSLKDGFSESSSKSIDECLHSST